ncbi:Lsr2 family protein [Curtobacterium sp. MCBD17_034]|uniref:histone-like nucleoid-structuring protein Lsr2 n=1 Tax=unclassified Curtobacterium TaxID=257496 RepID=UPI000DA8D2BE|nr:MULTISPECIES: Lsr2 family protein [unclassified Curtobacterium]PZF62401.1 Lsr2 family protein [Curtobacterium sp. MCBD17_034]PZM39893.1 Lsr2 family protein [Curtobacterium sp. MCBD17_031]
MAQKVTTVLVDDLDNETIAAGEGRTVSFGYDGANYEIDLSNAHADELREALSDYIAAARKVGSGNRTFRTSKPTASKSSSDKSDLGAIREWASTNGYKVSERGRISGEVRDAYDAAH